MNIDFLKLSEKKLAKQINSILKESYTMITWALSEEYKVSSTSTNK